MTAPRGHADAGRENAAQGKDEGGTVRAGTAEPRVAPSTPGAARETGPDEGNRPESRDVLGVLAMVKALERERHDILALNEALAADLEAARAALATESAERERVQGVAELLRAQVTHADQLQREIAFVEEERDMVSRRLKDASEELVRTTEARDSLAAQLDAATRQLASAQSTASELRAEIVALEMDVKDLHGQLEGTASVREEFAAARKALQSAEESLLARTARIRELGELNAALELDLATSRDLIRSQQEMLAASRSDVTYLRGRIEKQGAETDELRQENRRLTEELTAVLTQFTVVNEQLKDTRTALENMYYATAPSARAPGGRPRE